MNVGSKHVTKSRQQHREGVLRICASCEWIFKEPGDCPKCQFGTYTAHSVYGKKAYEYAVTQQPWVDKKLASRRHELRVEVLKTNPIKKIVKGSLVDLRGRLLCSKRRRKRN